MKQTSKQTNKSKKQPKKYKSKLTTKGEVNEEIFSHDSVCIYNLKVQMAGLEANYVNDHAFRSA